MDQLEDERPPGYNPGPPGQEIPAHQALEHRALAAALEAQITQKHAGSLDCAPFILI